ncbi:MAG: hypothetical protein ACYDH5_05430 [Acidimicrobiales bacterium]
MAQTWVVIGILGTFSLGMLGIMWPRMDRLGSKVDALGTSMYDKVDALGTRLEAKIDAQGDSLGARIGALADRQAQMNGEMRVLREMAHTHSAA